jgi:channel protein (hemolysin III family)
MIADPTNIDAVPGLGEPLSAVSHLAAALVFLALSPRLIRRGRGNSLHVLALSIFAFACVFQLAMSGVYHQLVPGSKANQILLRLDHAAIFFLIAATFTPVHIILFNGFQRWGFLAFIWTAAIAGIVLKALLFAQTPMWVGLTMYLGLGWTGLISGAFIWKRFGYRFMAPLFYGGIAYSAGVVFEAATAAMGGYQLIPGIAGGHEVFHFAVLLGMAIHWKFIGNIASQRSHEIQQPL